jgi:hypothetical protein
MCLALEVKVEHAPETVCFAGSNLLVDAISGLFETRAVTVLVPGTGTGS